jgi:hypothetical protein
MNREGQLGVGYDPFAKPTMNDRNLRRGDVSNRRLADVADRGLGRLNLGGKRAYKSDLGKDRTPTESRHCIASAH